MKKIIMIATLFGVLGLVGIYTAKNPVYARSSNSSKIIRIEPYVCGLDACDGYRCVGDVALDQGISVSPACYNATQLHRKDCRQGSYVKVVDIANRCTQAPYYFVWTR